MRIANMGIRVASSELLFVQKTLALGVEITKSHLLLLKREIEKGFITQSTLHCSLSLPRFFNDAHFLK